MIKLGRWIGAAAALGLTAAPAAALEKVNFLTSWKAQAEHGGYYQALVKGYYRDCGLDVNLRQGGPGIDPAQLLVGRAVDFNMTSHIDAVLHMNVAGFRARALMAAFQITPQMLMTHPDGGINSFEDMKGRPILVSQGSRATYWPYFRKRYGWDETQLRSYTGPLAQWLSDKTSVQQGIVTAEPYIVKKEAGWEPKSFLLSEAGYRTYNSMLTTSQEMIDQKPKVVQCMVSATRRGWIDFMTGDPTPALKKIQEEAPNNSNELMAFSMKAMKDRKLVMNEDTDKLGFGMMTEARWKTHYEMLREVGLLKTEVDYRSVYNIEFLKNATN